MSRLLLAALVAMTATGAAAGDWQYDPGTDLIFNGPTPVARWYDERPLLRERTVRAPDALLRCPHHRCGYPLPIYKTPRFMPAMRTYRVRTQLHGCRACRR